MADIELGGESFRISESVPPMVLMRLARVAKQPMEVEENLVALAIAMDEALQQLLDPADWDRFQDVAVRSRASMADLADCFQRAQAARKPAGPPVAETPEQPAFELFPA